MVMDSQLLSLLTDPRALQTLGSEIAKGFQSQGGNFSALNPTGEGKAGGRGSADLRDERKAIENTIKTRQLESKFVNQVSKNLKVLTQELEKSESDYRGASEYAERFSHIFGDVWTEVMDKVAVSKRSEVKMINALNAAMDEDIKTLDDVLKVRQRQQTLEKEILDTKIATSKTTIDEYNRLSKALGEATHGLGDVGKTAHDWFTRSAKAFFSFEAALLNLTRSLNRLYDDYKTQIKLGSQINTMQSQWLAVISGTDPRAFVEMMGGARQASLAFGDVVEYSDLVAQQQKKYFNQIGDLTEASKFTHDMFMMLGRNGIKPNAKAMDQAAQTFRVLNKIAGVTSEQFTQLMDQTLADVDIQTRLRVAKQGERAAIIAGIQKQIEMNVAMGLTVEQATAAAVAMGKIAGGGAKERFKRAAQMQMAFGALGIEGGARAAELTRKGQARMSPAERIELEALGTKLTEAATATKGGSIAGELMADTLLEKTGLGQYFGPDSPLNKQLAEGLKAEDSLLAQIRNAITDQMTVFQKFIVVWQTIANFLSSGLGGVLTSVLQGAGAIFIGGVISKLGFVGALRALLPMISSVGTALGAAGTAIASLAGPIAAVAATGVAAYKLGGWINEAPEKIGWDSLSTNIGDLIDRISGNVYDPNEGLKDENGRFFSAQELREKQLQEAQKQTAMQELQVQYNAQQITAIEFSARMQRISTMGSTPGLANN